MDITPYVLVGIGFVVLYFVVRRAVRDGIRDANRVPDRNAQHR